ncbi:MAG: histidine phosphatase family protein [Planctomycetes bacterium]|nr:histidine phosphatase family protein [Planctomycetota bacterium]
MSPAPAAARRLWLVRHGETEGQSSIRFHGSNDVRLSDVGRAQIRALAPLLAGVDFARVVHSPLQRAAESAAILAGLCGVPAARVQTEERLREISFGACEGMTEAEIAAAFPDFWRSYQGGGVDTFPDGEPRQAFVARVRAAVLELAAAPWHGDLLVVSHRGTTRQMLRALLAVPAGGADAFGVELGSVTTVRHAGQWQIEALGLLP